MPKKNITRLYFRTFFKPTWKLRGSSLKIKLNMQSHSMFVVLSNKSYPNLSMIFIPHARNSKYEMNSNQSSSLWVTSYLDNLPIQPIWQNISYLSVSDLKKGSFDFSSLHILFRYMFLDWATFTKIVRIPFIIFRLFQKHFMLLQPTTPVTCD